MKNEKIIITSIISFTILLLAGVAFYWYELRPTSLNEKFESTEIANLEQELAEARKFEENAMHHYFEMLEERVDDLMICSDNAWLEWMKHTVNLDVTKEYATEQRLEALEKCRMNAVAM